MNQRAEFGRREWLKLQLARILSNVRKEASRLYGLSANQAPSIDFDTYSFINLSRRKKVLWSLLTELEAETDWLRVSANTGRICIEPACKRPYSWNDPTIDAKLVELLQAEGIPATHSTLYR